LKNRNVKLLYLFLSRDAFDEAHLMNLQ